MLSTEKFTNFTELSLHRWECPPVLEPHQQARAESQGITPSLPLAPTGKKVFMSLSTIQNRVEQRAPHDRKLKALENLLLSADACGVSLCGPMVNRLGKNDDSQLPKHQSDLQAVLM